MQFSNALNFIRSHAHKTKFAKHLIDVHNIVKSFDILQSFVCFLLFKI